jgi:hypothetical protein
MRKRGLAAPDNGDALALTFPYPVACRDWAKVWRTQEKMQKTGATIQLIVGMSWRSADYDRLRLFRHCIVGIVVR